MSTGEHNTTQHTKHNPKELLELTFRFRLVLAQKPKQKHKIAKLPRAATEYFWSKKVIKLLLIYIYVCKLYI